MQSKENKNLAIPNRNSTLICGNSYETNFACFACSRLQARELCLLMHSRGMFAVAIEYVSPSILDWKQKLSQTICEKRNCYIMYNFIQHSFFNWSRTTHICMSLGMRRKFWIWMQYACTAIKSISSSLRTEYSVKKYVLLTSNETRVYASNRNMKQRYTWSALQRLSNHNGSISLTICKANSCCIVKGVLNWQCSQSVSLLACTLIYTILLMHGFHGTHVIYIGEYHKLLCKSCLSLRKR